MEEPSLLRWLKAEALVGQGLQSLVSLSDSFAQAKREAALGCIKGRRRLAGLESVTSDLLEQVNERCS